MTALLYARQALDDLERLVAFLLETSPNDALDTYDLIESALCVLQRHPQMGRPVEAGLRELVISRGRTGYLALYRFDEVRDEASHSGGAPPARGRLRSDPGKKLLTHRGHRGHSRKGQRAELPIAHDEVSHDRPPNLLFFPLCPCALCGEN